MTTPHHIPSTCTVCVGGTADGRCGQPAVWSDGRFAECAKHAADPGAMAKAPQRKVGAFRVGDHVQVHRYGKVYDAVVTKVGARGAAYATFTYGNGAERTVRVED